MIYNDFHRGTFRICSKPNRDDALVGAGQGSRHSSGGLISNVLHCSGLDYTL